MITKQDINETFAKSFEEMNKAVQQYVADEIRMWATKTPEEYEAWRKARDYKLKHKEDLASCLRSIAGLKDSLAFEERSLAWLMANKPV